MKKVILPIIVLSLLFGGVPTGILSGSYGVKVFAQETELPDPGLTPDSSFYFLERISEAIGTFLTFGDLKKAERYTALAAERLAEASAMREEGKLKLAEKTLERYENQLEKASFRAEKADAKGKDTKEVTKTIIEATYKHLIILNEVLEKAPEEAKPAIERAMIASAKGHEKAVEALEAKGALGEIPLKGTSLPTEIPEEVRETLQREVQKELEQEKVERAKEGGFQSYEVFKAKCLESGAPPEMCTSLVENLQGPKSLRTFCIEQGGPPEVCERFPLGGFESFKQVEALCLEAGAPPEMCSTLEGQCREMGVTTPNECYLVMSIATVSVTARPAPAFEEQMEELRIQREAQEELGIRSEAEEAALKKVREERIEEARLRGEPLPGEFPE